MRFFTNPRKPMILALARPDPKKNITTLVKAFGECRPLRELANLVGLSLLMILIWSIHHIDIVDKLNWLCSKVFLCVLKKIYSVLFFCLIYLVFLQTLIMGNRDGIDEMSSTSASVLLSILKLIDKYDLYGQVAYPKHHKQSDVPDIYRLAAKTKVDLVLYL